MTKTVRAYAVRAGSTGPITFLASTHNLARDGLIIEQGAWNLEPYRRNPVVLWGHDYRGDRPPIGKATDVRQEAAGLVADLVFDQGDPFARDIERKIREGYLNSVSVGWDTILQSGNRVTKAELLDISVVPVPGDSNAVALARSAFESAGDFERRLRELGRQPGGEATLRGIHAALHGSTPLQRIIAEAVEQERHRRFGKGA